MEFLLIGVVVTAAAIFLFVRRQKAKARQRAIDYTSKGTAPTPGSVPEVPAPVTPATPGTPGTGRPQKIQ